MNIVFIWIQWSWKWTQARLLEENYNYKLYETWWALREIAKQETSLWKMVKETIESWKQVSPEIVEDILKEVINSNKWTSIILDWFVRNKWNKESVDKIVGDYKVIFFDLSQEEAKKRLLWRMYDPETWETFPANTKINPKTWWELIKRSDDEESSINERINQFFEKTMPVVEEYKNDWKLITINANQEINKVFDDLKKSLNI